MKFSIVIPVWNSEQWLEKCFNSILEQTYQNYEVIIVDDMSTDNGYKIIEKYRKLFKHCKVIYNKTKRLSGGSRNVGVSESTGYYIICMDCDDWLVDNKVLEDIDNKLKDEDVMFLGFKLFLNNKIVDETILNPNNITESFLISYPATWLKVVKRDIFLKSLFPEGTLYEDRIQNFELIMNCKKITSLGRTTHVWNRDNKQSTTYNPKWAWYRFEYCGELYRLIAKTNNEKFKNILINDLKTYMKSCDEMVASL